MPHRPTRWELAGDHTREFGERLARLVAEGADVDGEARLADVLVPRGARVLDVGSGMGRVAATLQSRGHRVTAVEPDPALVEQSRRTYPGLAVTQADILEVDLEPGYDLVVLVGNVMAFLAEGTEREVLGRVRALLGPGGRVLVGMHQRGGPDHARRYPPEELEADALACGLDVDLRAGSYELHPPGPDYSVWVLSPVGP
ncbi:methyltransferase type 12 [Serinicoccus chungangensis]|uniref:Methyltransferase type 12 n=1 Tax=Serinicoccus chungangensis TaxID=767452 RepID=A0A0W8I2Q1_9MICO|nr:class I SAM-dependent methyltransferase [Serinicoccus chungangensis]KUG51903.1 methyltransferase type 12 [Serinicoccus chungangensis]